MDEVSVAIAKWPEVILVLIACTTFSNKPTLVSRLSVRASLRVVVMTGKVEPHWMELRKNTQNVMKTEFQELLPSKPTGSIIKYSTTHNQTNSEYLNHMKAHEPKHKLNNWRSEINKANGNKSRSSHVLLRTPLINNKRHIRKDPHTHIEINKHSPSFVPIFLRKWSKMR